MSDVRLSLHDVSFCYAYFMENLEPKIELSDETPISQIEPIEEGGFRVESREDLERWVEPPLLEACQVLFDKGIKTVFSSANKKDVGRTGYIAIDFESLTPENKAIAERIGQEGKIHGVKVKKGIYLQLPITEASTLRDIKERALVLVSQLEDQSI